MIVIEITTDLDGFTATAVSLFWQMTNKDVLVQWFSTWGPQQTSKGATGWLKII